MNALHQTPTGKHMDEGAARKLLRAYDLLSECVRSDDPGIRNSSRKARAALGPVILVLDLRREPALDRGEFQGLFMDG